MADETTSSSAPPSAPAQAGATDAVESALTRQSPACEPDRAMLDLFSGESQISGLPMQLDVTVPIPEFRVQNLLTLKKGTVIKTRWPHTDSIPIWCGGAQLVWADFEVRGAKLAVRVTRLR